METKFAFKLNQATDEGIIYSDTFIEPLKKFIEDSGVVFMYNGSSNFLDYSKDDFIGVADSYKIEKDIITVNFTVMNKKYNALANAGFVLSMPLLEGKVNENKMVEVNVIDALIVMM